MWLSLEEMMSSYLVLLLSTLHFVTKVAGLPDEDVLHTRHNLGLENFCKVIKVYTKRENCLDYNNYGCFCGLGSAGTQPVDEVDGCCRIHDNCYGQGNCTTIDRLLAEYTLSCNQDKCTCSEADTGPCMYDTCLCDLAVAQCFKNSTFNEQYRDYDRTKCIA